MGIIEKITGYIPIERKDIDVKMLKIIESKIKHMQSKTRSRIVTYVNGNTFRYKIIQPGLIRHIGNGHVTYMSEEYKIYRKLKK